MTRQTAAAQLTLPVGKRDDVLGPATAPVTMVEYGDFECPYCGQAYYVVKSLIEQLGRRMCFVFRHFPLASIHPFAELAAEAAEAAAAQGKFWEMHSMLYEHQDVARRGVSGDLCRRDRTGYIPVYRRPGQPHSHSACERFFKRRPQRRERNSDVFHQQSLRHDAGFDFATLLEAVKANFN